ncbi:MAG: hypothetical protein LBK00_08830 [Treponema sp.]|jgi:hypothetical protein|nr:hypothetical protein [Treponema sp.]
MLYCIRIKTADKYLAGTDANIFISLVGEKGTTREIRLNPLISGDAFERNDLDHVYDIDLEDVGQIKELLLRSDEWGLGPDWYPDYISVARFDTTFNIGRWIEDKNVHRFTRS